MHQRKAINISNYFKSKAKRNYPIPDKVWQNPLYFIAFGFGIGTITLAPGTFGTLLAIPFYLLMQPLSLPVYLLTTILVIIITSWICHVVSRDIHIHDHPGMCIDEFPGFFVTMINAPMGWQWLLTGFILFRIFDILKPWPIQFIDDHIPGGFGMILDDVAAGLYSLIIMQFLKFIFI